MKSFTSVFLFRAIKEDRGFDVFDAMQTAFDNGAVGVAFFSLDPLLKNDRERHKDFPRRTRENKAKGASKFPALLA
ncbi:hypothetical protein [Pontiella sp.]|uniref:hypothetical protein n=1 Tax=Pontiella sp. TaxID=2837462 RepID=UPI00356AF8A3